MKNEILKKTYQITKIFFYWHMMFFIPIAMFRNWDFLGDNTFSIASTECILVFAELFVIKNIKDSIDYYISEFEN